MTRFKIGGDDLCDEVAGYDEKDINTYKSTLEYICSEVEKDNDDNLYRP